MSVTDASELQSRAKYMQHPSVTCDAVKTYDDIALGAIATMTK
jgi:hypothetical protein